MFDFGGSFLVKQKYKKNNGLVHDKIKHSYIQSQLEIFNYDQYIIHPIDYYVNSNDKK